MQVYIDNDSILVAGEPVGPFQMNQYLFIDKATGDAAIVDSGGDPAPFLALIKREGGTVKHLLQTHAHIDHISGLEATKAATSAPIYLHPLDLPLYARSTEQAKYFGFPPLNPPAPDIELAEGDVLSVGELRFSVLHTPGHAPGHVCFQNKELGLLFGGDLLFRQSIGRTDLPLCDAADMQKSLARIRTLPSETVVFPGHMQVTTIGQEVTDNPFLQGL